MKNRILLLSFIAAIFCASPSFLYAEEQIDNMMPPGLADIMPKGEAGKEFQKRMHEEALKIEKKCDEFKGDNSKFNACVQQHAPEAAKSLTPYLSQAPLNKSPDELIKANKDTLEQSNKILQQINNKKKADSSKSATLDK